MESFSEFLQNYVYLGVFMGLLLCGIGLPIPEEVVLVIGGYLVYAGDAHFWHMALACFVGVLIGDILIYTIGHFIGNNLVKHPYVSKLIGEKTQAKVWAYFQKYGNKTIFFSRFFFGIRAPLYFTAGSIRMKFWDFLKMDA